MKKVNGLWVLAFVLLSMTIACGGGSQESAPASTPAATPESAPASGASSIGVPECDDYLSKVEACIANHVPEDAKAMQQQSMEQMRTQWRQAAETETGKASLAAGCKAALDAARSSMAAYGCEF
ncbi:MAG TPA: hypothetical protein VJ921_14620 [Vicinamibacteria bacterium]|nr:hypothetical protein [Vicinamibacteria bacterium]